MKRKGWNVVFILWVMGIILSGCGAPKVTAERTEETKKEAVAEAETAETASSERKTPEESTKGEKAEEAAAKTEGDEVTSETPKESAEETTVSTAEETTVSTVEETAKEETKEASAEKLLKEYTGPVQAFETPETLYATIGLNIRKGPGTEYEIIGSLTKAQAILATGRTENGWIQFEINGQVCFASGNYLSETIIEPAPKEEKAASTPANVPNAPNTANTAVQGGIILIGDSRCVQMQSAVNGGGCTWICENGKGYKWLNETAIGLADPAVGNGTKVVFCLGVNDPGNVRNYAQLVNEKAAEWLARGAIVYYVSVNPVWENPYVTQAQVDNFNNTMPGLLSGVIWVDTQSWLKENGCRIVDGLHYDDATSINIFNLIINSI